MWHAASPHLPPVAPSVYTYRMKRISIIGAVALGVTLVWACSSAVEDLILTPDASAEDERPAQPKTIEVECENRWYLDSLGTDGSLSRTEYWYAEIELERFPNRGATAFVCGRTQQFDFNEIFKLCPEGRECETNIDTRDGLNPLDCISASVTFDANSARVSCGKTMFVDGHVSPFLSDHFRFTHATFVMH